MASKTPSTRTRSTTAKTAPPKRAPGRAARAGTVQTISDEAKTAVRSIRTRATRAARKMPTDRTSLSIAFGVVVGFAAAGVALFMNRERLRAAAATGGEKLKQAADDLSEMAHDRIDQARDNITRLRGRADSAHPTPEVEAMTITG